MKYRKLPVVIDAWAVNDILQARVLKEEYPCVAEANDKGNIIFCSDYIIIKTLEGWMEGNIDDMIIRGIHGELYPCKPDIFNKTYERAE